MGERLVMAEGWHCPVCLRGESMKLYEVLTGGVGYAECRAYVWAESEEHACILFRLRNPTDKLKEIRQLMTAEDEPFSTQVDDCRWEM